MNTTDSYPDLISADVFRDLSPGFLDRFLRLCNQMQFRPHQTILTQGDPVDGMYIIADGSAEITCRNDDGQRIIIHLAQRGEIFGEVETLSGNLAAASCVAATETRILFCPRPLLLESFRDPVFVRNVTHVFYDRLVRDNHSKFVDQFYPVDQKLRSYLYRLSGDTPEIAKTQADLAGLLGCARQTLNRELGKLRDQNVIVIEKGRVRVTDRDALVPPGNALA